MTVSSGVRISTRYLRTHWGQIFKPTLAHITISYAPFCSAFHMAKQKQCTPDQQETGHQYPIFLLKYYLLPDDRVSIYQYIF